MDLRLESQPDLYLNDKKVVVGMSGGVDSSVAAYLLKEEGYDVIGVMLKLWSEPGGNRDNACCSLASVEDARRVAAVIGIPFYILDASEDFYREVVEPFIEIYLDGATPNPCAFCNPNVRWRWLLNYADLMGAKYVATGHYAQVRERPDGSVTLVRGGDRHKDQSYVLSRLPESALKRSLFPLATLTKPQVRSIAKEAGLPSSEKKESQDICFIYDGDYRAFLRRHAADRIIGGTFISSSGGALGMHDGLPFYTIGQRKGIRLATPTPKYVLRKDARTQTIVIGDRDELGVERIRLTKMNWLIDNPTEFLNGSTAVMAQTRYKCEPVQIAARCGDEQEVTLTFPSAREGIAPGQVCTLYTCDDEVVGSGIINLVDDL